MSLHKLLLLLCLSSFLAPVHSAAQEPGIDAAIEQSRTGSSVRDLQAHASAQPPVTDDKQALAIFYHKRGIARNRLGNYSGAVEDLRLALENQQPKRPAPEGWGDRWRINNDLGNAYASLGDWFAEIDLWKAVADEYRQSNLFNGSSRNRVGKKMDKNA